MGNSLAQYRVAIGMHKIYLTSREYRDCFKGKFWCSLLLLFYLEAIYLLVLKLVVSRFKMMQWNHLWLTQIYLYRFYIPELIRLGNDIETNPGPPCFCNIYAKRTKTPPLSRVLCCCQCFQNLTAPSGENIHF